MVDEQDPEDAQQPTPSRTKRKKQRKANKASKQAERKPAAEDDLPESWDYRLRRALIWVLQYWRELFNFRFDKYMIIQVIPGVYGLALTGIAVGLVYLSVEAFLNSPWRGLFYFFFAGPLAFLVAASTLRALLEFYIVIFKIAEHVDELVGMRDTVDRLSGIGDTVNEISTVTRRLPFWSAMSGRRRVRRTLERRRAERAAAEHKQKDGGGSDGDDNTPPA